MKGQRDGEKLATLAHSTVKADKATIAKALTGHWKEEHLFELNQAWQMYHFHQDQIALCDQRIEAVLQTEIQRKGQNDLLYDGKKKAY